MQFKKNGGEPNDKPLWLKILKGFMRFFARALVTVFSVIIISGCIIGCVLATVILGMVDDADVVDLDQLELSYTTIIYTKDPETGVYVDDTKLYGESGKLIWADYEQFPDYLSTPLLRRRTNVSGSTRVLTLPEPFRQPSASLPVATAAAVPPLPSSLSKTSPAPTKSESTVRLRKFSTLLLLKRNIPNSRSLKLTLT
ncbi:MAG: hypothetical protein IIX33_00685 [Oscillospiraceae bacterium]|nr:hypothetical protein [Oscillospiraceae bacterium]